MDGQRHRHGRPAARVHETRRFTRVPQSPPGGAEMIWLTWRQFRGQAIAAAGVLAAFALLLVLTAPHIADLYHASGLTGCHGDCAGLATSFLVRLTSGGGFP